MSATADEVRVHVEYRLAEYKRVLKDFIPIYLARRGKKVNRLLPWNWPVVEAASFALFVPPVFWIKKALIGDCTFTFTGEGMARTSKGKTASRAWSDVAAVHRLSGAYVIELKAGGAMPVPYRVFTRDEQERFESMFMSIGTE